MENKKIVLIVIIILLAIFAPLTVLGYIERAKNPTAKENPKHELYYKGYIWFYDSEDNYINKYQCKTETCELAKPTIDDDQYEISYYKDGTDEYIPLINNKYAFIRDGDLIYLYDITDDLRFLATLKSVKNYNTTIENHIYILQNENGLWGAFIVNDNVESILPPYEFNFIGLKGALTSTNEISSNYFIVNKGSAWYLLDSIATQITTNYDYPIVNYTENYVLCKDLTENKIHVYDYSGKEFLENRNIKRQLIFEDYIGLVENNALYIYQNLEEEELKIISVNDDSEINLERDGEIINIKVDGNIVETIALH